MARKGILSSDITKPDRKSADPVAAPAKRRGTVGALQSSLTKLQENAVQEIDTQLVDDAGVEDRLGDDPASERQLLDSLKTYGQQVPVLLRPHSSKPGRYQIVYGRRRLKALRKLGLPVKAMIRQLDDHDLVLAQGQENTARQDLSFIEKASFAAQLSDLDYDRQTIADALSIDLPMLSRLLKVGTAFDLDILRAIGSAPGIGRDRWAMLVKALETNGALTRIVTLTKTPDFAMMNSDARFEAALARAIKAPKTPKATAAKPRKVQGADGTVLGDIRQSGRGVTLTIASRTSGGFDTWINANAETLVADLHARWKKERAGDN